MRRRAAGLPRTLRARRCLSCGHVGNRVSTHRPADAVYRTAARDDRDRDRDLPARSAAGGHGPLDPAPERRRADRSGTRAVGRAGRVRDRCRAGDDRADRGREGGCRRRSCRGATIGRDSRRAGCAAEDSRSASRSAGRAQARVAAGRSIAPTTSAAPAAAPDSVPVEVERTGTEPTAAGGDAPAPTSRPEQPAPVSAAPVRSNPAPAAPPPAPTPTPTQSTPSVVPASFASTSGAGDTRRSR